MLRKTLLTLLCLLGFSGITLGKEKNEEWGKSLHPNPEVQAELNRWHHEEWPESIKNNERLKSKEEKITEEEIKTLLKNLLCLPLQRKAGGAEKLFLEIVYFRKNAYQLEASALAIYLIKMSNFPLKVYVGVPLRYLDSKDPDLQQLALRTVIGCEYAGKETYPNLPKEVDYSKYEKLFQEERQAIPAGLERLVKRMYRKDADQALLCFSRVYMSPKEAEKVDKLFEKYQKEKATFQLLYELMAPENKWSDKWFIQLYVAAKILQEKPAVAPSIKETLDKTPHQVVWEFMNEKVEEKP